MKVVQAHTSLSGQYNTSEGLDVGLLHSLRYFRTNYPQYFHLCLCAPLSTSIRSASTVTPKLVAPSALEHPRRLPAMPLLPPAFSLSLSASCRSASSLNIVPSMLKNPLSLSW